MKVSKSQPKFSIRKYENFFTHKNFQAEMYMDEEVQQATHAKANLIKAKSEKKIKAKLNYSLSQRVQGVLLSRRKLSVLDKDQASRTKSISKISRSSMLPPIRTENKETEEYLVRIKKELNVTMSKNIRLEKEMDKILTSKRQIEHKIKFYKEYENRNPEGAKNSNSVVEWVLYQNSVLQNMRKSLKQINFALNKQKIQKEKKVNEEKLRLRDITRQLEEKDKKVITGKQTKEIYRKREKQKSNKFKIDSSIAASIVVEEFKAESLKENIQQNINYTEDKYIEETNYKNHCFLLTKYRAQVFLQKIIDSLMLKYKKKFNKHEKCQTLFKMYSIRKYSQPVSISHLKSSNRSSITEKSLTEKEQFDLITTYNSSFQVKKQLEDRIKQYEEMIKLLEKKKERTFQMWADVTYNDRITDGSKVKEKKVDLDEYVKNLSKREEIVLENENKLKRIKIWMRKQSLKIGLKLSKKTTPETYLKSLFGYVLSETKNVHRK